MCGESKKTTTSSGTSGPEEWARSAGKDIFTQAQGIVANSGNKTYTGPRVADYGANFDAAKQAVADYGANNGSLTSSAGILDSLKAMLTPDAGKSVGELMNPFTEAVLNPTLRAIAEKGQEARNQIGAQATMAGAYGDTGHGLQTALQRRDETQAVADTTGKAYSDAFNAAQGQQNTLRNMLGNLFGLYNTQAGAEGSRASNLATLNTGLADKARTVEQSKLDAAKDQTENAGMSQVGNLAKLMALLQGAPVLETQQGTSTTTQPNTGGFDLLGKLGAAALTAWSDARLKREIVRVGTANNGLPIYSYRYIGDDEPRIGVMAQDVEKFRPEAIYDHPSGFMKVDYEAALA